MKTVYSLVIALILVSCAKPQSPEELLAAARQKIKEAERVELRMDMVWESPDLGEFDTIVYSVDFRKNEEAFFGYDFFGTRDRGKNETAYFQGVKYDILHADSTVRIEEVNDSVLIEHSMLRTFNPVVLLEHEPWRYLGDTTVQGKRLLEYLWIKMDTVIDERKVYLGYHLWINPANLLPDFFSSRLYHNGAKRQRIESRALCDGLP
jgi:hypothetical protein